jgi:hypothetical protein
MGSEPVEDEIPIQLDDFPILIQDVYSVYTYLQDIWEGMSGTYMGKSMNGIVDIFTVLDVDREEQKLYLDLIRLIDSARSQQISEAKPKAQKAPPA